jgi:hypothetical protein
MSTIGNPTTNQSSDKPENCRGAISGAVWMDHDPQCFEGSPHLNTETIQHLDCEPQCLSSRRLNWFAFVQRGRRPLL